MFHDVKQQRLVNKLNHEFGSELLSMLSDPMVTEIMLNPDEKIFLKMQSGTCVESGVRMDALRAHQLMGSLADFAGLTVNQEQPTLETALPGVGYRFTGFLPPLVSAPSFTIRKQGSRVLTLEDQLAQKVVTPKQVKILQDAILADKTFLISGGPGTGKTTFANSLLDEMTRLGDPCQRFVCIEDMQELKFTASNVLSLKTSPLFDHEALLKKTLRSTPDRIIVGECRGKETLTLLKAWNTGTRGGLTTLHSNTARSALFRIEAMANESGQTPSPYFICESIQMIVVLDFSGTRQRVVREIVELVGYSEGNYVFKED